MSTIKANAAKEQEALNHIFEPPKKIPASKYYSSTVEAEDRNYFLKQQELKHAAYSKQTLVSIIYHDQNNYKYEFDRQIRAFNNAKCTARKTIN